MKEEVTSMENATMETATRFVLSTSLLRMPVQNRLGERLGSVRDIVFAPDTGLISYVIVGYGGFLGVGEKRIAVPWSVLRLIPEHGRVELNISKQEFRQLPTLEYGKRGSKLDVVRLVHWHQLVKQTENGHEMTAASVHISHE